MSALSFAPPRDAPAKGPVHLQGVWLGHQLCDAASAPTQPTGHSALDAQLPGGGWPIGALTEVLRHMATNMSINEMMTLVLPVFCGMEDMDTAGFPAAGDFRFDITDDRQSIISFDQQSTITRLHDYIYEGIQP